jgi:hypothetical protein
MSEICTTRSVSVRYGDKVRVQGDQDYIMVCKDQESEG